MKAVFPTNSELGLTGTVYGHFGSAPFFVLVDTDSMEHEVLINHDKDHIHGQCQPLKALGGIEAEAIVVGGIGKGALTKLAAAGIKAYKAVEGTVEKNLDLFKSGSLSEYTIDQTCSGHTLDGSCAH